MPALIDLSGRRFERLTVIRKDPNRSNSAGAYWIVRCDCGTEKSVHGAGLRTGTVVSCGCYARESASIRSSIIKRTHGLRHCPEYAVWNGMLQRCGNPHQASFRNYGARGIAVCPRWHEFTHFIADMGRRPSPEHTIERIDNDRGYEPGNCRWATRTDQARNRRSSRLVTIRGETACVAEWMERLGLSRDRVLARARAG